MDKITHTYIHPECKGQAFNFVVKPRVGERCSTNNIRRLDGSIPSVSDPVLCGSCGGTVHNLSIKNVRDLGDLDG